jgi:hypothetical protein
MDLKNYDEKGNLQEEFDLDMSLDDVEDLPGFAIFPTGAYLVSIDEIPERKEIDGANGAKQPILEVKLRLEEIVEMSETDVDPDDMPKINDVNTISFQLKNRYGIEAMKKFLLPIGKHLGTPVPKDIIGGMKGLKLAIAAKRTYNKDKDRHYSKIKKVAIV